MYDIRMKRFYGRHLDKYTGDTQAQCTLNETGIANRFAPLHKTGFSTTNGWSRSASLQAGTLKTEDKSGNMEKVEKFKKTNQSLQEQLDGLSQRINTKSVDSREAIFHKIAQKTLDR